MTNHILIAAAQKSGSTYLSTILSHYFQCDLKYLSESMKGAEHELSHHLLNIFDNQDYVSSLHLRCSYGTTLKIAQYKLNIVLIVRNIFDTMVSLKDHIRRNSWNYSCFGSPIVMTYVPREISGADDDYLYEFIADCVLPWYFSFYTSWLTYDKTIPVIRYEPMITDTFDYIYSHLIKITSNVDKDLLAKAIEISTHSDTKLNVGKIGRGIELEEKYSSRIYGLSSYYPKIDFKSFFER